MKLLEACGAKHQRVKTGSLSAFGLSSRPFRFQGPEADGGDLRGPALDDLFVCFVAPARWLQIKVEKKPCMLRGP